MRLPWGSLMLPPHLLHMLHIHYYINLHLLQSILIVRHPHLVPTMTTLASSPPEKIGYNPPTFNGNRKKTKTFIIECSLYLRINAAIYDTDESKIAFILSLMTGGEMELWIEHFFNTHTNETTREIDSPTYSDFIGNLKEEFKAEEHDQEALIKLFNLKQGNRTAKELVNEFKFLASEAGLGFETYSDHVHMIRLFQGSLNLPLLRKIFHAGEVPNKIDAWFKRAIQIETRMVLVLTSKDPRTYRQKTKTNDGRNLSKPTTKEPKTIGIHTMSQQERTDLMKKGACFKCKKRGHLAKDCQPERTYWRKSTQEFGQWRRQERAEPMTLALSKPLKEYSSLKLERMKSEDWIDIGLSRYILWSTFSL